MKKLTTLILLLLSPMVTAQDEAIDDIFLKCDPIDETYPIGYTIDSHVYWIAKNNTFSETYLLKESAPGFVDSPTKSLNLPPLDDGQTAIRRLRTFRLYVDLIYLVIEVDRMNGIGTSIPSLGAIEELEYKSECRTVTKEGVDQLLSEYNQKLQDAKNKVIEARKF